MHAEHQQRPERGPQAVDAVELAGHVLVALAEALNLALLLVECLHDPDARNRVGEHVGDARPLPPGPQEQLLNRLAVPVDQPAERRHRDGHHQSEAPVGLKAGDDGHAGVAQWRGLARILLQPHRVRALPQFFGEPERAKRRLPVGIVRAGEAVAVDRDAESREHPLVCGVVSGVRVEQRPVEIEEDGPVDVAAHAQLSRKRTSGGSMPPLVFSFATASAAGCAGSIVWTTALTIIVSATSAGLAKGCSA